MHAELDDFALFVSIVKTGVSKGLGSGAPFTPEWPPGGNHSKRDGTYLTLFQGKTFDWNAVSYAFLGLFIRRLRQGGSLAVMLQNRTGLLQVPVLARD